jgi:Protein of unknown function (DUF669)
MTEFNFDPATEEGSALLIPPGLYLAEITSASTAETKNGNGQQLHLTWRIIEGEQENRYVWQSLMYAHTESAMAVKIGRAGIKDICTAAGITEAVTDHEVFVGKTANIRIGIQKDKRDQYPDRNAVLRVSKPTPPKPTENTGFFRAPANSTQKIYEPLKPVPGTGGALNDSIPF